MTRKEALEAMLVDVDAGKASCKFGPIMGVYWGVNERFDAMSAYNGSLDAALVLHESVLGDNWHVENFSLVGDICLTKYRPLERAYAFADMDPARAWLIAIIKALIVECGE